MEADKNQSIHTDTVKESAETSVRDSLRRLLPLLWKRRWLIALTFVLMCCYSAGLVMRNLVPSVFLDEVLISDQDVESILARKLSAPLELFGLSPETRDEPYELNARGRFTDLVISSYEKLDEIEAKKTYIVEKGVLTRVVFTYGESGDTIEHFPFDRVTLTDVEAEDIVRGVANDGGKSLSISRGRMEIKYTSLAAAPGLDKLDILKILVLFGLVVCVFIALSRFFSKYLEQFILQHVLADLRQDLIGHMSSLSLSFFNNRSRGDLLSRVSSDLTRVSASLQLILGDLVQQPVILVFAAAGCLYICPQLAIIVFLAFPFLIVIMLKSGRRVRKRSRKQSTKRGLMTVAVEQLFSGIRTVKSFRMEEYEKKHFLRKNMAVAREALKTARAKILATSAVEFISHLGIIVMLAIGGWLVVEENLNLSIGELGFFIAGVNTMYHPVKVLTKATVSFQDSMGAMDRVMELLDSEPTVVEAESPAELAPFSKTIRYEKVFFNYGRESVLKDINFEIRAGTLIAIVGRTGSGKSTLVDLLLRFYDPSEGRILIDNVDIRSVTLESLISQISVVSQDPFLFDTTISNNIRYGRPEATQAEVEEAARASNVHDEILGFPEGYDTDIGDRGVMLSGGQRQRVTIARALLKHAPILILDEATSSLDSESEASVQEALGNLMKVRSTIAIAHRLSTIIHADTILVLDAGRIVERGTYRELIDKRGYFYQLYSRQSGGNVGAPEKA